MIHSTTAVFTFPVPIASVSAITIGVIDRIIRSVSWVFDAIPS